MVVLEHDILSKLKDILSSIEPGKIADSSKRREIESELMGCWDQLSGSSDQKTYGWKLSGRMESIEWHPPHLHFWIERHGITQYGSSKASMHRWCVDVSNGSVEIVKTAYRQLGPISKRFDAKAAAMMAAELVKNHTDSEGIIWASGGQAVDIKVQHFIPEGVGQTVIGRRKRFRTALQQVMAELGWKEARKYYRYERETS